MLRKNKVVFLGQTTRGEYRKIYRRQLISSIEAFTVRGEGVLGKLCQVSIEQP